MSATGPPIDIPPRPRQPGTEVWRLQHPDGRELRCVTRDDTAVGAGVDVLLFDGAGELLYTKRCVDLAGALFIANAWRQDHERGDWMA